MCIEFDKKMHTDYHKIILTHLRCIMCGIKSTKLEHFPEFSARNGARGGVSIGEGVQHYGWNWVLILWIMMMSMGLWHKPPSFARLINSSGSRGARGPCPPPGL